MCGFTSFSVSERRAKVFDEFFGVGTSSPGNDNSDQYRWVTVVEVRFGRCSSSRYTFCHFSSVILPLSLSRVWVGGIYMGLVGRDFAGSWVRLGRVLLDGSGT